MAGDQVLDRHLAGGDVLQGPLVVLGGGAVGAVDVQLAVVDQVCLLYTSDAADPMAGRDAVREVVAG